MRENVPEGMPPTDAERAAFVKQQLDRINRRTIPRGQAALGRQIVENTREGRWDMAWALARELKWDLDREHRDNG